MANFYIQKLIITGSGKETAVVDFVDGLNIVCGPSNTGKSYVSECIDYMFGADEIRFDSNTGYDVFKLLISTNDGNVTMERKFGKNIINVSSANPNIESGEYTSKWYAKSKRSDISDVWLSLIGINEKHNIIKNGRRESQRLTWRIFSHMFLIKETMVLQEKTIVSPIQKTLIPAAFSALYFLITGEDFSDSTPQEEKKVREARKKAVISYINAQLSEFAKKKTALTKLPSANIIDLQAQVEQIIDELAETERQITAATVRSKSLLSGIYSLSEELAECNNLYNRYQALRTQYSADIQRLTFIVDGEIHHHEMGENSMCPFCDGKINPRKEKSYIEASKAELTKIRFQLEDLRLAESDLVGRRIELEQQIAALNTEKSGVENLINSQLRPKSEELKQSLKEYRYAIEIHKESNVIGDFEKVLQADLFEKMTEEEETDNVFKIKSFFDASIFKQLEALHNGWTGRELERQITSSLFERLLLSNDKESVLAVARKQRIPEKPSEIIKDPMYLEFLGLKRESSYYEKDFESALIAHLQEFILELGNGFAFMARQKRILLEDDEFFADLVFYNRLLRCFVVIEIKTHRISHEDIGQLQMYVNYFDRYEKLPDENPTVGILLCAAKNDTVVKITLPENNNILASRYELYLPKESELLEEVNEVLHMVKEAETED